MLNEVNQKDCNIEYFDCKSPKMDQVRGHVPPLKENHHTFDQGPNQKYNFLLDTVGFLKHPSAYVPALKQNKEKTDFLCK